MHKIEGGDEFHEFQDNNCVHEVGPNYKTRSGPCTKAFSWREISSNYNNMEILSKRILSKKRIATDGEFAHLQVLSCFRFISLADKRIALNLIRLSILSDT